MAIYEGELPELICNFNFTTQPLLCSVINDFNRDSYFYYSWFVNL